MRKSKYRVFVANLPWDADEKEIRDLLEDVAPEIVSIKVCVDKVTGKSRGFGFVELRDDVAVEKAIKMSNGKTLAGRRVKVERAREPEKGGK